VVAIKGGTGARRLLPPGRGQLQFPDSGDVRPDLRTQLHAFLAVIKDSPAGSVIAELIGKPSPTQT